VTHWRGDRYTPRKGSTSLAPLPECLTGCESLAYVQDVQKTEYEPTKTTANAAKAPATPAIRTGAERERSPAQAISPARGRATRA
jgi:hypothetical protein